MKDSIQMKKTATGSIQAARHDFSIETQQKFMQLRKSPLSLPYLIEN
jgi:hypothetical protein